MSRQADIVRLLLDRGANPEATDSDGETALMLAARRGYDDILQLLLAYHADARRKDSLGRAALYFAYAFGHERAVDVLENAL